MTSRCISQLDLKISAKTSVNHDKKLNLKFRLVQVRKEDLDEILREMEKI